MKLLFVFFGFSLSFSAAASFSSSQINVLLGRAQVSFSEAPSLGGERFSGSASSLGLSPGFEHSLDPTQSVYLGGYFPVMGSKENSVRFISASYNFYFLGLSGPASFDGDGGALKYLPRLRGSAGPYASLGYLVYSTTKQRKSDAFVSLGATTSFEYAVGEGLGVLGRLDLARAVGVNTSSLVINFFVGVSQSL